MLPTKQAPLVEWYCNNQGLVAAADLIPSIIRIVDFPVLLPVVLDFLPDTHKRHKMTLLHCCHMRLSPAAKVVAENHFQPNASLMAFFNLSSPAIYGIPGQIPRFAKIMFRYIRLFFAFYKTNFNLEPFIRCFSPILIPLIVAVFCQFRLSSTIISHLLVIALPHFLQEQRNKMICPKLLKLCCSFLPVSRQDFRSRYSVYL